MKSRISFFDGTIFKKNLTRFAPAWGLYTIYLLMALMSLTNGGVDWFPSNLCDFVQIQAVFTFCYALLCAQLLFGDLYNTRMCNALHALPLRRETWFVTNVVSGFAFHLIPTVIFAALTALYAALACYPGDWHVAALWLLGVNLQFICFFGIAVFSAFCVGNRFAQAVVYGIVNFASLIAGWLVDTIFIPMYYGIKINLDPFFRFSPVAQMVQEPFCLHNRGYHGSEELELGELLLGANFFYYFLVASVGIVLIGMAMGLYRRRKLECAGDFMAIRTLEPVFLVVYTIILGAVFQFAADDIFGMDTYLFLFLGLAVGWFTGKMLLERTPRVFRPGNCLRCGALMAVCALVMTAAAMDPFGIEGWMPEAEDVESVTIADGHYNHHQAVLTMEDPAGIQKFMDIHQEALFTYWNGLDHQTTFEDAYAELIEKEEMGEMDFTMAYTFTYRLKNGREVNRYYHVWMGGETGQYLKMLSSTPEAVFGYPANEAEFLSRNNHILIHDTWKGEETFVISQTDMLGLYRAILADCEAGTMAQNWNFHNADHTLYWISFSDEVDINVSTAAEHTLQWLKDYGLDVDALREERLKY